MFCSQKGNKIWTIACFLKNWCLSGLWLIKVQYINSNAKFASLEEKFKKLKNWVPKCVPKICSETCINKSNEHVLTPMNKIFLTRSACVASLIFFSVNFYSNFWLRLRTRLWKRCHMSFDHIALFIFLRVGYSWHYFLRHFRPQDLPPNHCHKTKNMLKTRQ